MWLWMERRGRMVKKCGWGSKHVAGGWQMCIIEQINEKKCRKKKKTYLGPKRRVWHHLGLLPTHPSIPVFVGPRWSLFSLRWPALAVIGRHWLSLAVCGLCLACGGSKQVVWMLKCMAGVLRRVAERRNMWLWVGRCTIGKNIKKNTKNKRKNTPMAQTTPDASFGPVVVIATPQSLLVLWKT
jgi:hypothetical protein